MQNEDAKKLHPIKKVRASGLPLERARVAKIEYFRMAFCARDDDAGDDDDDKGKV